MPLPSASPLTCLFFTLFFLNIIFRLFFLSFRLCPLPLSLPPFDLSHFFYPPFVPPFSFPPFLYRCLFRNGIHLPHFTGHIHGRNDGRLVQCWAQKHLWPRVCRDGDAKWSWCCGCRPWIFGGRWHVVHFYSIARCTCCNVVFPVVVVQPKTEQHPLTQFISFRCLFCSKCSCCWWSPTCIWLRVNWCLPCFMFQQEQLPNMHCPFLTTTPMSWLVDKQVLLNCVPTTSKNPWI